MASGRVYPGRLQTTKSGRRGDHSPRPPTPPDVLTYPAVPEDVSDSKAAQGSLQFRRRRDRQLLEPGSSGSAVTATAGAEASQPLFAVVTPPSSLPSLLLASSGSALRPKGLLWPLLTSLDSSPPVAESVVGIARQIERSPRVSCSYFTGSPPDLPACVSE